MPGRTRPSHTRHRAGLASAVLAAFIVAGPAACRGETPGALTTPLVGPPPAVVPPVTVPPEARQGYYVAPDGSAAGDGSASRPWDLRTALAQPGVVQPGDTIWLRGGTYRGEFRSTLTGTAARPVVLRQYPGERATVDGRLEVGGRYAYYWGFEVMYSDPRRVSTQVGSDPTDLPRERVTVFVTGTDLKLINLVVHDLGDGIFAGVGAANLELYGNLVYNNGWLSPERGSGHNLYLQNLVPTKRILDNVVFHSFAFGMQLYGSDAAAVQNFQIEGNTVFESGAPAASRFSASANIMQEGGAAGTLGKSAYRRNSLYHRGMGQAVRLNGDADAPGDSIEFRNNIVQGLASFNRMRRYVVSGNTFSSGSNRLDGASVLVGLRVGAGDAHVWTNNRYAVSPGGNQDPFYVVRSGRDGVNYTFDAWRTSTGYDAGSTYLSGTLPVADVVVRPNTYEPGRAFVTCWNWRGAAVLPVDLSGVLKPGDRFEIHHVYDVFGAPVLSGTYEGRAVSIPQTVGLKPPAPIGYDAPMAASDGRFGVFLVRRR